MEAQKLGGSDMLILAASWIFLMASGELPTCMLCKEIVRVGHNGQKINLGESWGLLGEILKPLYGGF